MKIESDFVVYPSQSPETEMASILAWQKLGDRSIETSRRYEPSTWVKLSNPPTAFSFDEAWLLCQCDDDTWLAWIPDYGEILLNVDEFYWQQKN
jgi:hypothetical protein